MSRTAAAALTVLLISVAVAGCLGPTPNQAPHPSARIDPAEGGVVGQEITFIGSGHDADGSVTGYRWDFGDGTPIFQNATRGSTVHTYAAPGLFVATFSACDDRGDCGQAAVNVTIEAGLTVAVNWTGENAYTIQGSPSLDGSLIRVTLQAEGGQPVELAVGTGLEPLGGGQYKAALGASTLARGQQTSVQVSYNGSQVAARTVVAQPFAGSSGDSDLGYYVQETEAGPFGAFDATASSQGLEMWLVAGGLIGHAFVGTGFSNLTETRGGSTQVFTQNYTRLAWNQSWGRYDPTIAQLNAHQVGTGVIDERDASGVHAVVNISDWEASSAGGNQTALRASGTGYYEGGLPNTFGSLSYRAQSQGTSDELTGRGTSVRALRVAENFTYTGTLGGAAFTATNLSERLVATSDAYFPADFWVSWNETGMIGTQPLADTGVRFIDSDGDGRFNPDLRPAFPSDGRNFAGLVPSHLAVGDQATLTNGRGDAVVVRVVSTSQTILIADGFTSQAVTVAQLSGSYGATGQPSGSLSYVVVAEGPHALLALSGGMHLTLGERTFDRSVSLIGKP